MLTTRRDLLKHASLSAGGLLLSDALAAAVAHAQDPASRYLMVGLNSSFEQNRFHRQFNDAHYDGFVCSRAWTIQLLREYATWETTSNTDDKAKP